MDMVGSHIVSASDKIEICKVWVQVVVTLYKR